MSMVEVRTHQPVISRRATAVTVVVSVLIVAGAVRMMVPGTSSTDTVGTDQTSAEITTIRFTTVDSSELRSSIGSDRVTIVPTSMRMPAELDPTDEQQDVDVPSTDEVIVNTLPVNAGLAAFEMASGGATGFVVTIQSGRYVATTSAAVGTADVLELELPSGQKVTALVVSTSGPAAVLDLVSETLPTTPTRDAAVPEEGSSVVVGSADGEAVPAIVGSQDGEGLVELSSDSPLHESGPVYDMIGRLLGVCTHNAEDQPRLVPLGMLDAVVTEAADSNPSDASPSTSTVAPSTSVVTTTTTTSSTTTSTTTTTVPKSSTSTSTSAPATSSTAAPTSSAPATTIG